MQVKRILPWLLVAAVIALAALTLPQRGVDETPSTAGNSAEEPANAGERHDSDAAPITADPVRKQASAVPREAPTHADMLAAVESNIRTLDAHFIAEPLDGAWARGTERSIGEFFDPAQLTATNLGPPSKVDSRCHSSTCRVTAYYDDQATAEQTTQRLTMHLLEMLPYGAVMPRQMADGRIEVNAWYSSRKLTP